jgi:hypothetical protein
MTDKQNQKSGDNSVNQQAGGNFTNLVVGVTYDQARQIAIDVFDANFLRLSQSAAVLAEQRAKEFITSFLEEVFVNKPNAANEFQNPDFQYVFYTAQKEYARTGNNDNKEMLLSLLMSRVEESNKSLRQIVLNEAVKIVSNLTIELINIIAFVFLISEIKLLGITNLNMLIEKYFNKLIFPILQKINDQLLASHFQRITFTGCASIDAFSHGHIMRPLLQHYSGLFCKGFSKEEFHEIVKNENVRKSLLLICLNDVNNFQNGCRIDFLKCL